MDINKNDAALNDLVASIDTFMGFLNTIECDLRIVPPSMANLRGIFFADVVDYMAHLAGASGEVTREEVFIIGKCLKDQSLTQTSIKQFLKGQPSKEEYFKQIPKILVCCKELDPILAKTGQFPNLCLCNIVIKIYTVIENLFISCNGNMTLGELYLRRKFLDMMQDYVAGRPQPQISTATRRAEATQRQGPPVAVTHPDTDRASLDELIKELDSLIGLAGVKEEVHSLIHLINNRKRRERMGLKSKPMSMHLIFTGNPGTGKTTVARLLGKIYFHLGILSKGHYIETQRSGLVGGYVGQTAIKVQEVIRQALGGVLFIDEAYSLVDKGENDYGSEAVDTLLKAMEDHRDDLVVIAAGYPQEMDRFLQSNPGLPSRFNKKIFFEDYSPDELTDIFLYNCRQEDYQVDGFTISYIRNLFTQRYEQRDKFFGNGRFVRNFYEKVTSCQVNRLEELGDDATRDELQRITIGDVKGVEIAGVH